MLVCVDGSCSHQGLICCSCYDLSHKGHRFISVHGLQKQCQGRHQSREVVEAAQAALRRLKDVQAAVKTGFGSLRE